MTIKIIPSDSQPKMKVADVEVHFDEAEGLLNGLRLLGFAVWERKSGAGLNVTFPARTYSVNGERRSFSLLRPSGAGMAIAVAQSEGPLVQAIIQAYLKHTQPVVWEVSEEK